MIIWADRDYRTSRRSRPTPLCKFSQNGSSSGVFNHVGLQGPKEVEIRGGETLKAVMNGSTRSYALSAPCQLCHRRAWRLFGLNRRSDSRISYRCSQGHITLREPWVAEFVRAKRGPIHGHQDARLL